jgi:hypothetical protein
MIAVARQRSGEISETIKGGLFWIKKVIFNVPSRQINRRW